MLRPNQNAKHHDFKSKPRVGITKNSKETPGNQAIARFPGILYAPCKMIETNEGFKEAVNLIADFVYK